MLKSIFNYLINKREFDEIKDLNSILDEIKCRYHNKIAAVVNNRAYVLDPLPPEKDSGPCELMYPNITYAIKFKSLETFELAVDFILSSLKLSDNELISFRHVGTEKNSIYIRAVKLPADKFRVLNREFKEDMSPQFDTVIGV